ncbi:CREB-binding protein [Gracilariopsis chorda]|uniref:CREB-binding protein n=1 Tax=Gracilariopsis chorda TaxID=448386 RepID=A0A2V3ITF4_9FLOR|nr:CREB-binding protein [Gracilariopsis chorda]|eukprot:PXF45401.1 CREB-binding protein [Gracilariopsis chorda]
MGRGGAPTRRGRAAKGAKAQSSKDTSKVLDIPKEPHGGKSTRGTRASKTSSTDTGQDGRGTISTAPSNQPSRTMPSRSRRKPSRYSTQETRQERDRHENEGKALNDGMELLDLFRNTLRKITEEPTDEGRTDAARHGMEIMKEALLGHKVEERDWASFDVLSTMSEALDLNTEPSLEYTLGVLGVTELPETLQERTRAQGAKAYNEVFRNSQIRRRKQESEKQKKEAAMKAKKEKERKQKQKTDKSKARKGTDTKERKELSSLGRERPKRKSDRNQEEDKKRIDLEENMVDEGKTEAVQSITSAGKEGEATTPMETNLKKEAQEECTGKAKNNTQESGKLQESKPPELKDDALLKRDNMQNAAKDEEMKDISVNGDDVKESAEKSEGRPRSRSKETEKDQERLRRHEETSKLKEQANPPQPQLRRSSRLGPAESSRQDNPTPTGKDDTKAAKPLQRQPESLQASNMDVDMPPRHEGVINTATTANVVLEPEKEKNGGTKSHKEGLISSTPEDSSPKLEEKPRKFTRMATKRRGRTRTGTRHPQEKESSEQRPSIASVTAELATPRAEHLPEKHVIREEDKSQKSITDPAVTERNADLMTDSKLKDKESKTNTTGEILLIPKKDIQASEGGNIRKSATEAVTAATAKKEQQEKTDLLPSAQAEPSEHVESLSARKQEKEDVDMLEPHQTEGTGPEPRRTHDRKEPPVSPEDELDADALDVDSNSQKPQRGENAARSRVGFSKEYPSRPGKEPSHGKNAKLEETENTSSSTKDAAKGIDGAVDDKTLKTVAKERTDGDTVHREEKPASRTREKQRPEVGQTISKNEQGEPQGLVREQKRLLTAEELEKETMAAVFGDSDDEEDMGGNAIDLNPSESGEHQGAKDEDKQKVSTRTDARHESRRGSVKEGEDKISKDVGSRTGRGRGRGRGRRRAQKETKGPQKAIEKTERRMSSRRYSGTRDDLVVSQTRQTRLRRESTNLNDGRLILHTDDEHMRACAAVWQIVHDEKISIPFRQPVQKKDAPDYFDIVKKPMDLATVRKNMESGVIMSPIAFYESMMQIVKNAFLYNAKHSDLWGLAMELQLIIRDKTRPIVAQWCDSTGESYEFTEDEDSGEEDKSELEEEVEVAGAPRSKAKRLGRSPKHKKSEDVEAAPPSKRGRGRGRGRVRGRRGAGMTRAAVGRKRASEVDVGPIKTKKRRVGRPRKDGN